MAQYVSEENLKQYDKLLKEYIQTKSESLLDLLSYGVRWEKEQKDPHLTRIGNLEWHRTLPLQSQMRGCIVQSPSKGIHIVKYWLHPDDWRFRKDNAGYVFIDQQMTFVEKISDNLYKYTYVNSLFDTLRFKHQYLKVRDEFIFKIIDIDPATNTATVTGNIKFADTSTYQIEIGSCTNGYDGEVMVYMPGGYLHSVDAPTYSEVRISPFNVGGDWEYHKPGYISAYRITVLNEVPTNMGYLSTIPVNSAISVANVETYCRGGGNRPEYDQYLETDPFRSDLGKGIQMLMANARTYARNCNNELLSYFQYKWLVWLYIVEYANFNSQEEFNLELTTEGYKQGGMGEGLTNLSSQYLNIYNNSLQICPNGYLSENGNITNIKEFNINLPTTSEETEHVSYVQYPFSYRGIENLFGDTYIGLEGIVVKSLTHTIGEDKYHTAYITNNPKYYSNTLENKEIVGSIYAIQQGVINEFDLKDTANIFPISIIKKYVGYTVYKCDPVWAGATINSLRKIIVGGPSIYGSTCGLLFFHANSTFNIPVYYRSFKELSMESIVITSDSNAPLMTAMYNAGLASNPDYMTKSEAEKVTTLNGIDFTNVISFDEFKYFTGVTEIPDTCFLKNTSLTSIICPDSLVTIGNQAFSTCSNLSYVKIGKYVTSIGSYVFGGCSKLTNIIIPNFVTSIGEGSFQYCYGLKSVKLGNSLTSISSYMFRECTSLKSVIIPDSVTTIGAYAFQYCKNLTSIIIPNSVTFIENAVFESCYKLTSLRISKYVTQIKGNITNACNNLNEIIVEEENPNYDSRNNCNAIIETSTNKLISGCKNTIIPNTVTSIKKYAFFGFSSLTSIIIPESVTSIDDSVFKSCANLTSITCLATTAPTIQSATFGNSDTNYTGRNTHDQGINKLYIPAGATGYDTSYWLDPLQNAEKCGFTIELLYAVKRETNPELMDICVANGWATNKDYMTFEEAAAITSDMIAPNEEDGSKFSTLTHFEEFQYFTGVKEIKDSTFYDCESLTSIIIPDSVTSIGNDAFGECYELINITIPNSVTSIGDGVFYDCSLTSINIPDSVNYIGEDVFNDCSNLNTIIIQEGNTVYDSRNNCNAIIETDTNKLIIGCKNTIIPNSVTSIGSSAFYGHSSLISIIIPNSVTSIGSSAFYGCSGLTSITIPNSVTSIQDYTFYSCSGLITITIPDSVTSIGNSAFQYSGITSIVIPNSVTSIGNNAFSISKLTSITIPSSVTSIGNSLFSYCSRLESIVVESGNSVYDSRNNCNAIIETATNKLLYGCKNTVIPNSVTSIDNYAFTGHFFTQMTIPNSVTSIGNEAFGECERLTSIIIPNSVTTINDWAFQYCRNLTSIVIGNSITSLGNGTFRNCYSLSSIKCLATTAPTVRSVTFGDSDTSYAGRNTHNQGINKLKVPTGATGYDTSAWKDPLQNSDKCGFTIEYI